MSAIKSPRLMKGDTVAIVSPSWGGPSVFPHVYELGLQNLKSLGLTIREFPSARAPAVELYRNPRMRADDINEAFRDPSVRAIVTSIGGSDSIRILPFLDSKVIEANPKIFMGYSDATTLTTYLCQLGLVAFNGPAVMSGFAQMKQLPQTFEKHVYDMLFVAHEKYNYPSYHCYSDGFTDWSNPHYQGELNTVKHDSGMKILQGSGTFSGVLFGGCIEVLEFLKGTRFWPSTDFWNGKLLFFETSEEKILPGQVERIIRNYGMQGILERVSGLLVGRARDYSKEEKQELDTTVQRVVSEEFALPHLPIVTNMEFGHTDPQIILPLGVKASIDCATKSFRLMESCLQ